MATRTSAHPWGVSGYPYAIQRAGKAAIARYDAVVRALRAEGHDEEMADFLASLNAEAIAANAAKTGQQFADAADAGAIRLYNKNHYPKGTPRGGQFMPNNGGGGGEEGQTTVEYAGAAHEAHLAATLGRAVNTDDLARLTASPHGSHIRVVGSYVMSTHPDGTVIAVGVTGKHADGDLALHLDYRARGDDRHVSYTADQVRQIADAAQALGIAQVTTKGRRFSDDHMRLPRYGFDCPIHEALHESRYHVVSLQTSERAPRPPESFLHAGRLSEALVHADAREWWEQYGLSPHMEFDTAPGSASRQRLDAALREEGARTMADPLDILTRPTVPEPDYSQPDGAHGFRKLTKAERRRLNALWVRAFGPIPPWQDEWGPEPTDDDDEDEEG